MKLYLLKSLTGARRSLTCQKVKRSVSIQEVKWKLGRIYSTQKSRDHSRIQ